jgi:hypothetical protein
VARQGTYSNERPTICESTLKEFANHLSLNWNDEQVARQGTYSNERPTICASTLKEFAKRSRARADGLGQARSLYLSRPQKAPKKQHLCNVSIRRLPVRGQSENPRVLLLSSGNAYMLGRTLFESSCSYRVVMHATLLRRVSGERYN